ncbi:MAG: FecR domain-containing protein [Burkholderiales bacterium]
MLATASVACADEAGRIVFLAGQVKVHGVAVQIGHAVQEGDDISTGADGYVYLKTIDDGFLILRPDSRARIVAYHVDGQTPANTRIKFELTNGVARQISGKAVKQARENFRFNTPVAAIGVRGTDFTVYTSQDISRVTVVSGGVVVSSFGGACAPAGFGPCEGGASSELHAGQRGQLLEVRKGQAAPTLLKSNNLLPDTLSPPLINEPVAKAQSIISPSLDPEKSVALNLLETAPPPVAPPVPVVPSPPVVVVPVDVPHPITWGRYQTLLDQAPTLARSAVLDPHNEVVAENAYFAVVRPVGSAWQVPAQGTMGFTLQQSDAYVVNSATQAMTPATLANGRLQVNFATAGFTTGFDLLNQPSASGGTVNLHSSGNVTADGRLVGAPLFFDGNNMVVKGALSSDSGGSAAYIFQGYLNPQTSAVGVTYWKK